MGLFNYNSQFVLVEDPGDGVCVCRGRGMGPEREGAAFSLPSRCPLQAALPGMLCNVELTALTGNSPVYPLLFLFFCVRGQRGMESK